MQEWFDALWSHCELLDEAAIEKYAQSRRANNPPRPPPTPNTKVESPIQLLQRAKDWSSYVSALNRCDGWWSNRRPWSVLGDRASWRETVEVLGDIARHRDWGELGEYDRRRLLGLERGEGWALLGRMRPAAMNTVFGANRETIQRIVQMVATADDGDFPRLAFEAYENLRGIDDVGEGIASRLLTLARPERFVSVNGASRKCLADLFRLRPRRWGGLATTGACWNRFMDKHGIENLFRRRFMSNRCIGCEPPCLIVLFTTTSRQAERSARSRTGNMREQTRQIRVFLWSDVLLCREPGAAENAQQLQCGPHDAVVDGQGLGNIRIKRILGGLR